MAPPEKDRGVPDVARKFGKSSDIFTTKPATPQQAREAVAAYYACVSMVDAGIGRILDTLEEEGLADNTIVVFLGDHGFHLGEHGLWSKYTLFEQSRRAPLIVRVPGAAGNGQVCKRLVEFVDILPTLGELSGLELPGNLEGSSFVPVLSDPGRPWKDAVFSRWHAGESVRTDRYLFTQWTDDDGNETARMLYDHEADSDENHNIAGRPENAAIVTDLTATLAAGWRERRPV